MRFLSKLFVAAACLVLQRTNGLPIEHLPGLASKLSFHMDSGYINVDQKSDRNLFYWFVESQGNPDTVSYRSTAGLVT